MRPNLQFQQYASGIKPQWRKLIFAMLAFFAMGALHSQNITRLCYWFDNDNEANATQVTITAAPDIITDFNITSTLAPGLHTLNLKAMDENSVWSQVNRVLFCFEQAADPQIVKVEYFIDTDPGYGMGTPVSITPGLDITNILIPLDLNTIEKGMHHLFIRAQDQNGTWSMTNDRVILCEPSVSDIVQAEYFLDTDPGAGSGTPVSLIPGADITNMVFSLDMNAIQPGMHQLFLRSKDEFGRWSMTNNRVILCERGTLPDIVQAEYFFDTDPGTGMGTDIPLAQATNIDNLIFNADIFPLTFGVHKFFLRAKDSYGKWSLTNIADFEFIEFTHQLNVVAFLEGIYAGNGTMNQAYDETGPQWGTDIADQVTVELHNAADYSVIEFSGGSVDISTTGNVSYAGIPYIKNGDYYITIKHRNSIETTSATPVSFARSSISYDFSTAASMAFGDNMKQVGSLYVIWGGDVNQDGIIDTGDMNPVENESMAFSLGYVPEDVNGDGIVDTGDMNIVENNSMAVIMAMTP